MKQSAVVCTITGCCKINVIAYEIVQSQKWKDNKNDLTLDDV